MAQGLEQQHPEAPPAAVIARLAGEGESEAVLNSPYIMIAVVVVWLLSVVWLVQDAMVNLPGRSLPLWAALGLVLGPFAVPLYLSQRMAYRSEMRTIGRARTTSVPVPPRAKPFRSAGIRRVDPAAGGGTGIFVVVIGGKDAGRRIEIPAEGELTVRRAAGDEQPHGPVLVLHDDAVSRDHHCRISVHGGRVVVEDTSSFGTKVAGERIHQRRQEVPLGARLEVGRTTLMIEGEGQGAAAPGASGERDSKG